MRTITSPESELHSRAMPSVEAHHCSVGPDTGRNSGRRRIVNKKNLFIDVRYSNRKNTFCCRMVWVSNCCYSNITRFSSYYKSPTFVSSTSHPFFFFFKCGPLLVRRHLFWPSKVYILVIITHITHYKSCWTFCVGSFTCTSSLLNV